MYDLRHLNDCRPAIYDEFWEAVKILINDSSLAAADDLCHSNECHVAEAMSVTDLIQRVYNIRKNWFDSTGDNIRYIFINRV